MSLSRNPWHIREYTGSELGDLFGNIFRCRVKGISGNAKVMEYYERNRKSVQRIMKWDVLDLQHKLPAALLKAPYEMLNRRNRNKLKGASDELVMSIKHEDYVVTETAEGALDLLVLLRRITANPQCVSGTSSRIDPARSFSPFSSIFSGDLQ